MKKNPLLLSCQTFRSLTPIFETDPVLVTFTHQNFKIILFSFRLCIGFFRINSYPFLKLTRTCYVYAIYFENLTCIRYVYAAEGGVWIRNLYGFRLLTSGYGLYQKPCCDVHDHTAIVFIPTKPTTFNKFQVQASNLRCLYNLPMQFMESYNAILNKAMYFVIGCCSGWISYNLPCIKYWLKWFFGSFRSLAFNDYKCSNKLNFLRSWCWTWVLQGHYLEILSSSANLTETNTLSWAANIKSCHVLDFWARSFSKMRAIIFKR